MRRRIERLLDQAEEAVETLDWPRAREVAGSVLAVDPDNDDARSFLAMAEHNLDDASSRPVPLPAREAGGELAGTPLLPVRKGREPALPGKGEGGQRDPIPTSFADDRYQVSKFLGEGGKKRVYLAHDTLLDRDVAFALIKTEGLDEVGRQRVTIVFANGMVWQEGKRANWRAIFFDNLSHW